MFQALNDIINFGGPVFSVIWPFVLFIILFPLCKSTWLSWRQEIFEENLKWVLLELRIPREIKKSPRAMEQVLASLHSLRNSPGNIQEKYWDGEVTRWFALEMVSISGEVHLYVRTTVKQQNLVEAAFFSYYPDVEVVAVDDYIEKLPRNTTELKIQGLDMWGTEMQLSKEAAYPIKTYVSFEAPDEERQFDPISNIIEILGKVKQGEFVGIQILIAPADNNWKNHFKHLLEKLRETKSKKTHTPAHVEGASSFESFTPLSPGETDTLKAVEINLTKPAFETIIRFIYISPKALFYDSFARKGIVGAFNQYATLNLNSFKANNGISTGVKIWNFPYLFPKTRTEYRKYSLLINYRGRSMPKETGMGKAMSSSVYHPNYASRAFHMNTECLATIFHPPTFLVLTAPHMRRVESQKRSPPAGMAIFGDEKEIEGFQ